MRNAMVSTRSMVTDIFKSRWRIILIRKPVPTFRDNALVLQCTPARLQEAAPGGIAFETDGAVVGACGRCRVSRPRQKFGTRRPVGLVVGEARIVGERVKLRKACGRPFG